MAREKRITGEQHASAITLHCFRDEYSATTAIEQEASERPYRRVYLYRAEYRDVCGVCPLSTGPITHTELSELAAVRSIPLGRPGQLPATSLGLGVHPLLQECAGLCAVY